MKLKHLFIGLLCVLFSAPAFAQYTNVTASHIQSVNGTLLSAGYLCFTPSSTTTGIPQSFNLAGVGQILSTPECFPITHGAITNVLVPDTSLATPSIGYVVRILDKQKFFVSALSTFILPTGSTWSLDDWQPTQSIPILSPALSFGTSAPVGVCSSPSIYYRANGTTYTCINKAWVLQSSLVPANNLSDIVNIPIARANLGLGTAAVQPSTAFDAAGSASSAQTAAQATSAQRTANLGDLSNLSQARSNLGLGSAALQPSTAFDSNGAASAAQSAAIAASDPAGTAASVQSASVQKTSNLADLSNKSAALSNLASTGQSISQLPTGQNSVPVLNASSCSTSSAPSWCSGTDMGLWVMAAVAQLNGHPGKILVDATQTTWPLCTTVGGVTTCHQITLPMSVQLDCQSSPLLWQATSGTALAVASVFASSSSPYLTEVSSCYFQGPGSVTTSTNVGVFVGADPTGVITPTNTQGSGIIFNNVKVYGFHTGWTNGSNAFIISLHHVDIEDNYDNVVSAGTGTGGVINSGENMVLDSASVIANGAHYGMWFNGFNNRWHITDTSFDYNTGGNIFGAVNADFKSVHIEGSSQCMVSVPAATTVNMHFYGGDWYINNAISNTAFVCIPSRSSQNVLTFDGGVFADSATGSTVSNFISTGAATALQLCPGFTPVLYNNAIAPASFLVDSGATTCNGFGSSASANFVFNASSALLGISNVILQGPMIQTGGTGTTTVPFLLIQPGGPTLVTTWTNTGTMIGGNAPNGFSGLLVDLHVGGGPTIFRVNSAGQMQAVSYGTPNQCVSATSPASCAGGTVYSTGFVAVPSGGTTLQVNTLYQGPGTVTSNNSGISLTFDSSLSAKLGVTCDAVVAQPTVSARNLIGLGGSFTITMSAAPTAGKFACVFWNIYN